MKAWMWVAAGFVVLAPIAARAQDEGDVQINEQGTAVDEGPAASPTGEKGSSPTEAPPPPPITLSIKADAGYAFRADLKDADASVARFQAGGGMKLGWKASEKLSLSFGADYEYSDYDFNGGSNIIAGLGDDPFDNFNSVGFSVAGTYRFNQRWFMTLGGFANGGWESGATVADGWTGGGYGTIGMYVGKDLAIGVGLGASSQLEADPIVFPAIFVRWKVSDQFLVESDRLGLRLVYTPIEPLDVYLRASWERREYRLADNHANISDGILRDTTVPVGVGVDWRPIGGLTLGFEVGAMVYSKLKFRNDLGNTVFDSELDPGPYVRFVLEYKF